MLFKVTIYAVVFMLVSTLPAYADEKEDQKALDNLTALAMKSLEDTATKWRCDITSAFVCSERKGCQATPQSKNPTFILLDTERKLYQRCDNKGCDAADVRFEKGGIYTHANFPVASNLFKVLNDGSKFVDVATIFESALISYGKCKGSY